MWMVPPRLAGAWYFFSQNSYINNSNRDCVAQTTANQGIAGFAGNRIGSNCSGDYNEGSFLVDYTFNRHFDIYGGVTFAEQTGGLNSGFLSDNSWAFATGVRVKW